MKEFEKDLQYMKERFQEDGLTAPESLSEDAVFAMLENVPQEAPSKAAPEDAPTPIATPKRTRARWTRPVIAAAACLCLAIGITAAHPWNTGTPDTAETTPPDALTTGSQPALPENAAPDENGLIVCSSYEELDTLIASIIPEEIYYEDYDTGRGDMAVLENAEEASSATGGKAAAPADSAQTTGGASGSDPAHSSTYTQVEGIDEADIVKTDGKYIYYVSDYDNCIRIASAKDGKTKDVAQIRGDRCGSYIEDLYISGDTLIVLGAAEEESYSALTPFERPGTAVTIFDITDRQHPAQLHRYVQSGTLLSSRLNGGMLYLVTNDYIYTYQKGRCFPCTSFDNDMLEDLPIGAISCFPEAPQPVYTVIGAIELDKLENGGECVATKAILGSSEQIYCSQESLYLAGSYYPSDLTGDPYYLAGEDTQRTRIVKLSLDGGKPACRGSVIVPGYLNDQFSMDDSGGVFKAATTTWRNGRDTNNLFLFSEDMEALGSVRGFAKDEHIEAVRYIKDKAYIITYEQTDPLFIIDLKDPSDPVIVGHVKISGFSTLLVPADEDNLLGIGFSTESTQWGEATDGLKLALFDISDPVAPTVADSTSFEGMESEVQYDHKALLVSPDGDYFALPYEMWTYNEKTNDYTTRTGILVFTAGNGSLTVKKDLRTYSRVRRCLVIGDYIYGICEDDEIEAFAVR